jgi:hypothetical protein
MKLNLLRGLSVAFLSTFILPQAYASDARFNVAADADSVYVLAGGKVSQISKTSGAKKDLASSKRSGAIVVDDNYVYWSTFADHGSVMKVAKTGNDAAVTLVQDIQLPIGLAQDDKNIYVATEVSGELVRISKSTNAVEKLGISIDHGTMSLVADGDFLYVGSKGGSILKISKRDGSQTRLGANTEVWAGMAQDSNSLYFSGSDGLLKIAKNAPSGTNPSLIYSYPSSWGTLSMVMNLTVDGIFIYFTTQGEAVAKVAANGGTPEVLQVVSQGEPWGIAVDSTSVYFEAGEELRKISK